LTETLPRNLRDIKEKSDLILGIESSCDETAVAVVSARGEILSNIIFSQIEEHSPYGGVVPEIAARSHIEHINDLVKQALEAAQITLDDLAAVAVTRGPGLMGGVMVGLMTAKAIAYAKDLPLIGVNHLEGHALSVRLTEEVAFPYLLLLVSGGHCQILVVKGVGDYNRLGTTIDDAAGEAFDKTAKVLGLGYPGGPAVEKAAKLGEATKFKLPRPLKGRKGCDFSFSGLKTAVKRAFENLGDDVTQQDIYDLAASFQAALTDATLDRVKNALDIFLDGYEAPEPTLVVAGGVAANSYLKEGLKRLCSSKDMVIKVPPPALCTDNGAMIAWAGAERYKMKIFDDFEIGAKARWPLDPEAAPAIGAGVKA
jgi:N6-L-threonylcarbamoyladenine synthase